ncbi:hemolysin III family protein [Sulfitobacter sp. S223]|uniref:PAQR family membrane homeostasis protein TrhA n=1 Tax=Sulfitobacter sp. S223 TaxID=2867023 RepID=UPI0021A3C4F4|nr:hemolysin III family protein [Sulfitobacter sp. S223]UWR27762.1 hemolysin III family protein [Sulfitobacter sp. S223]
MAETTYPSVNPTHRRADLAVHIVGLTLVLGAGGFLIAKATGAVGPALLIAVMVYVLFALLSNLASCAYHFSPWHDRRVRLRRIDHAAIYPVISGTFTPFFVQAGTVWTLFLLVLCWGLTALAMWHKITGEAVQARWSTASYLGLGAIGLCALPDMGDVPLSTLWFIIGGAFCYVIGTMFYVRRSMPYRYAIWHTWVNFGGIAMFAGIWIALFPDAL